VESNCQKLDLINTGAFPKLFLDYISKKTSLEDFYGNFPDLDGFKNQLNSASFSVEKRTVLVDTLKKQYKDLSNIPDIDLLLDPKTFTVTTGHQLNIFTGPLYIIYKIVCIINLSRSLKKAFPEYNFVPVYWMATEDHDFEEISYFNLFGQKHVWETEQRGAVGRMHPGELRSILDVLREKPAIFENAYLNSHCLADAVRHYMHELFGAEGLISIDADNRELKSLFKEVIKDDLFNHAAVKTVTEVSGKLDGLGYKTQIHPREINFFYLDEGTRERIERQGDKWKVVNTAIEFTEAEILNLIENEPEKFSPNVVLRPLFQETILPNLAYIGGPSEVPYWLQLKGVFDHYKTNFPILMPRNFALIVNPSLSKKAEKLGIAIDELFDDEATLRKRFVERNSENSLSLAFEIDEISEVFRRIALKAQAIDQTLKPAVDAENAKFSNALENLEKKLKKAEERHFETSVTQLLNLREKLFPGGGLQERKENLLNFYLNDPQFLEKLLNAFDPLDFRFNILYV
jgi:bacillithiol biosynthesis cysteine-adding enzyme BshC